MACPRCTTAQHGSGVSFSGHFSSLADAGGSRAPYRATAANLTRTVFPLTNVRRLHVRPRQCSGDAPSCAGRSDSGGQIRPSRFDVVSVANLNDRIRRGMLDNPDSALAHKQLILKAAVPVEGRANSIYEEVHPMRRYNNAKTHRRFLQRLNSVLPGGCCPIVVTDAGLRGSWFRDVSLADQVGACTVTTRRSRCWPRARPTPRGPGYVRDDAPFAAQDPLAALFRYGGQVRRVRCQRANMTCEGAFVARRSVPTSSVALRPSALHSRTAAVAGAPCRRGQSRQSSQASHCTPRSCTPKACGSGRSWGKTKASSDSTRGREARTDRPRDDPRRARPSCGTPKCVHGAVVRPHECGAHGDRDREARRSRSDCLAWLPGQAHSLYGSPAAVSRLQGGHVSSPLPGIGVNFLPQRRHRRFRTRRSSLSKNRPCLVPAISAPLAPDYRAGARPARARRPPIEFAVRRHGWDTGTASRACCATQLDRGTFRTSPCVLPRQPRKRGHRSGDAVMAGVGHPRPSSPDTPSACSSKTPSATRCASFTSMPCHRRWP